MWTKKDVEISEQNAAFFTIPNHWDEGTALSYEPKLQTNGPVALMRAEGAPGIARIAIRDIHKMVGAQMKEDKEGVYHMPENHHFAVGPFEGKNKTIVLKPNS